MFSARNQVRIEDVPDYEVKTPLQRAIQIMKRYRNEMFCESATLNYDEKPISIIINTLAALSYNNQANLYDALISILEKMPTFIETRYVNGKAIKWIANPVDSRENFADKWEANPVLERNFFLWHTEMKNYVRRLLASEGSLQFLNESLRRGFGDKIITRTLSAMGEDTRTAREAGTLGVTAAGIISESAPKKVPNHNFYGSDKND